MYGYNGELLHHIDHNWGNITASVIVLLSLFSVNSLILANDFIDNITVSENDGVYFINASSEIRASEKHVRQVLTDYIHIYRLNDSIVESRILTPPDTEKVQVETLVQCCIPMFCKEVTRVEEVSETGPGVIQTKIIPEKSDFSSGNATWRIESNGKFTNLSYTAKLEPNFFIPPFVGTQVVVKNMRSELNTTFYRIERIAAINQAREWNTDFLYTSESDNKSETPCSIIATKEC